MQIQPSGKVMGAMVTGVDLTAAPNAECIADIYDAFLNHRVIAIREQNFTPNQLVAAGQLFGETQVQLLAGNRLDDVQDITVISNYNELGGKKPHVRATYWHTDDSYFATPAKATILFAIALPSSGGSTQFINTAAILDAMPLKLRQRIDGRRAVHKYLSRRNKARVANRTPEEVALTPDVSHPLIRTHPETGEQALYINPNRIDHIEGLSETESDELLDEIYDFAFKEQFQYHHPWQAGDMVMWDNRCTMHRASTDFDITQRREFHRLLLRGTAPA